MFYFDILLSCYLAPALCLKCFTQPICLVCSFFGCAHMIKTLHRKPRREHSSLGCLSVVSLWHFGDRWIRQTGADGCHTAVMEVSLRLDAFYSLTVQTRLTTETPYVLLSDSPKKSIVHGTDALTICFLSHSHHFLQVLLRQVFKY